MPRTEAEHRRLTQRAKQALTDGRLLRLLARGLTSPAALADLLADVRDVETRGALHAALAPFLSFSVTSVSEGVSSMADHQSLNSLDKADHLTKRGGGTATHRGGTVGASQRETTHKDAPGREPIGPSSASNYGKGAAGRHGKPTVAPHKYNKPAAGKKLDEYREAWPLT